MPLVSRTRATLRSAEFGFLGVGVYTRVHTPRFCGQRVMAGALPLYTTLVRPLRMSWEIVGISAFRLRQRAAAGRPAEGPGKSVDRRCCRQGARDASSQKGAPS